MTQREIDELAIQYNKTKDPGIRDQWYKAVRKFVSDVFNIEYTEIDMELHHAILMFQEDYVTNEATDYPYQSLHSFNFWDFINAVDEFREVDTVYEIDIGEKVKGQEYFNRFYYRRRQGWGKSIFKKLQKNQIN